MGFVSNLISGAAGYALSEMSGSHPVRTFCDRNFGDKSLEDTIRDFARTRCGIDYRSNEFAKRLHDIAQSFEEYNYDDVYGENAW